MRADGPNVVCAGAAEPSEVFLKNRFSSFCAASFRTSAGSACIFSASDRTAVEVSR